jgi:hypothetical protein
MYFSIPGTRIKHNELNEVVFFIRPAEHETDNTRPYECYF